MLTYDQLWQRTDAPAGSTWGLFGPTDEVGSLNFLTPERVRRAAQLVRRGAVFNLDLPLNAFEPPLLSFRHSPKHTIFSNGTHHRDDFIDGFYPQASTQIDGLRHMHHPQHAFYNGVAKERITEYSPDLGIQKMAERGIVGRGVVIDVERHLQAAGKHLDHEAGQSFTVGLLQEVCAAQGVAVGPGDILLIRTGWLRHYQHEKTDEQRKGYSKAVRCSGLVQSHETLRWLWENQIAVIACDNLAVEALPVAADSPFVITMPDGKNIGGGMLHPYLIGMMGFVLGELWDFEALAADCAADRRYECLLVAKPLNLMGGVGSPANATAIK